MRVQVGASGIGRQALAEVESTAVALAGRRATVALDAAQQAGAEQAAAAVRRWPGIRSRAKARRDPSSGWGVPYAGRIDRWLDAGTRERQTSFGARTGRVRGIDFYRRAVAGSRNIIENAMTRAAARKLAGGN